MNTEEKYVCNFCVKNFTRKFNLENHQQNSKTCLKIQGKEDTVGKKFNCEYCLRELATKQTLKNHQDVCKAKINQELLALREFKDTKSKKEEEIEDSVKNITDHSLVINNITIISRADDNYINATQLCQAGGKKFNHWYSLETTEKLINELSSNAGIPVLELVEAKKGGKHSGSWVHPDLGIQLAQWINPSVALQISSWIRTTGKIEIKIKQLKEKK
jgi:hypothetical protein